MPERDGYIPGVPCWVDTTHPDPKAAVDFYRGLFGWEFENVMADAGGEYFIARIRGGDVAAVGPIAEGSPETAAWNTYVWVDSADDTAARVHEAGGSVLADPFDVGDAGRMAVCADPEGAAFRLWQPMAHRGARVVNEHGALNFNGLSVWDVEGAKAFYDAVFGWQTLRMDGGEMWTLPAYGDHLEERSPGLRKMVADLGAPEGFVDVVASIDPIAGDQRGVPAHWSVTFGVDDTDAIAERAAELGGSVIVAPFDAPWVRATVLADPQGAAFIASRFVPENRDVAPRAGAAATAA